MSHQIHQLKQPSGLMLRMPLLPIAKAKEERNSSPMQYKQQDSNKPLSLRSMPTPQSRTSSQNHSKHQDDIEMIRRLDIHRSPRIHTAYPLQTVAGYENCDL